MKRSEATYPLILQAQLVTRHQFVAMYWVSQNS